MESSDSELDFFLLDNVGNRRVPFKVQAEHGPYGYALHPKGEGNNVKAARYTEDLRELVRGVVVEGLGVRTKAKRGPHKGQYNTLYLGEKVVSGYYISKGKREWIKDADIQPLVLSFGK